MIKITSVFIEYLNENEEIFWYGKPIINKLFTGVDAFIIPISVIWLVTILKMDSPPIIFIIFILYLFIGRFVYKIYKKINTYYAVTDYRILIVNTSLFKSKKLNCIDLGKVNNIIQSINKKGEGTLRFREQSFLYWGYENTGLDFLNLAILKDRPPAFYDIKDANKVYELINTLKNKHGNS
ncbi:MAG TPA: hypothetical protein VF941_06205 [Clostridia bacterium]